MHNNKALFGRRAVDLLAVEMIGDGVLALLVPTEHMKTWIFGPQKWRNLGIFFRGAARTDAAGAAEICATVWWVRRSLSDAARARNR